MPTKPTTAKPKTKLMFAPGHRACAGCGQAIAAKLVAETLGPNTIIANATGCLEVTTTPFPESSWGMPWIHSLFENAAPVASGILAALKKQGKTDVKVVAQGGDGSTFDIGFGHLSGMWERGENILYICYDNEAYSNTGIQASGSTPYGANTTTTPAGSLQRKKDMIAIALAHGVKYVAQTTVGYPLDIVAKVKKALETGGPGYIQILSSCVPGWGVKPAETMQIAKIAAQTGFYPLLEFIDGQLAAAPKLPTPRPGIEAYLNPQARFKHLAKTAEGKAIIKALQAVADENAKKYNL